MKRILCAIFILLLMSVSFGYCENQILQLTIKSDKEVYKKGEDIKLTLTFCNNSPKDIVFCKYIIDYRIFNGGGIKLENQKGDIYKAYCPILLEEIGPRKEDFITLQSNEKYTLGLQIFTSEPPDRRAIKGFYGIIANLSMGLYRASATYENKLNYLGDVANKKIIENVWTGTLTSNAITIEISGGSKDKGVK